MLVSFKLLRVLRHQFHYDFDVPKSRFKVSDDLDFDSYERVLDLELDGIYFFVFQPWCYLLSFIVVVIISIYSISTDGMLLQLLLAWGLPQGFARQLVPRFVNIFEKIYCVDIKIDKNRFIARNC